MNNGKLNDVIFFECIDIFPENSSIVNIFPMEFQ